MGILKEMLNVQARSLNCDRYFVDSYNRYCCLNYGQDGMIEYNTVFEGYVAEDSDLEAAFDVFGIRATSIYPYIDIIDEIGFKGEYWSEDDFQDIYYLTDGETGVYVPVRIIDNRSGSVEEESFLCMRNLVETERIEICDNCGEKTPFELIRNVDGSQYNDDLPVEFQNGFDGMVCLKCICKK